MEQDRSFRTQCPGSHRDMRHASGTVGYSDLQTRGAPVERGSDKHSPMVDEQLKHETEGLVRGGHGTHAEEWRDPEPSGEDQPDADLAPSGTLHGGTPQGMDADDVEGRAELATFLGRDIYPAV